MARAWARDRDRARARTSLELGLGLVGIRRPEKLEFVVY